MIRAIDPLLLGIDYMKNGCLLMKLMLEFNEWFCCICGPAALKFTYFH